ncbi:MAG TPA: TIGR03013 family PEP-CTERM/XrtA system glycosyltransferase [Casimicrobiaceae bacterium]|nr:TIGR03013 family PEP-CTERM/XrtA system glycosyltransferase [Casimicrobiaceae bacterium]
MNTTFNSNISAATLLQLAAELSWLVVAAIIALWLHDGRAVIAAQSLAPAMVFAVLMVFLNGAFGLYRRDRKLSFGTYVGRLFLAMLIGTPIAYLSAELLPGGDSFQQTAREVVVLAFSGLILVRHVVLWAIVKVVLPQRILVLGTGTNARAVEAALTEASAPGIQLVGFFPLETAEAKAVAPQRVITGGRPLDQAVAHLRVNEVIVAVREQRGGVLPLDALLECRIAGVRVTDLSRFFERVQNRIPIDALKSSWLIYGHGFRQGLLRVFVKRAFDIVVATALLLLASPVMLAAALLIGLESGFPVLYRQERVGLHGRTFNVIKFRSMRHDAEQDGQPRWATAGDARITRLGHFLRHSRIDELPQLINVLRGEMSFVGPRPERPVFVAMLAEKIPFYAIRHSVKPGLTGWAQVRYSYGASVEDSVRKLEYDLYYVKNHTVFLDLLILLETVRVMLLGEGAR